jgi:hypothetical protein
VGQKKSFGSFKPVVATPKPQFMLDQKKKPPTVGTKKPSKLVQPPQPRDNCEDIDLEADLSVADEHSRSSERTEL